MRAIRAERDRDPRLVRLRDGTGDPLVCVHAIGGTVQPYRELARAFPDGRPVLGIACSASDLPAIGDLAELGRAYAQLLTDMGIRPAALVGWSTGGLIGYEAARHLRVPLVLLDAMPGREDTPGEPGEDELLRDFVDDLVQSHGDQSAAPSAAQPATGEHTVRQRPASGENAAVQRAAIGHGTVEQRLRTAAGADPRLAALLGGDPGLTAELARRFEMFAILARLADHYRPPASDLRVTLVRVEGSPVTAALWGAATVTRTVVVPGDHYSLLRTPALDPVLEAIRSALADNPYYD